MRPGAAGDPGRIEFSRDSGVTQTGGPGCGRGRRAATWSLGGPPCTVLGVRADSGLGAVPCGGRTYRIGYGRTQQPHAAWRYGVGPPRHRMEVPPGCLS